MTDLCTICGIERDIGDLDQELFPFGLWDWYC